MLYIQACLEGSGVSGNLTRVPPGDAHGGGRTRRPEGGLAERRADCGALCTPRDGRAPGDGALDSQLARCPGAVRHQSLLTLMERDAAEQELLVPVIGAMLDESLRPHTAGAVEPPRAHMLCVSCSPRN